MPIGGLQQSSKPTRSFLVRLMAVSTYVHVRTCADSKQCAWVTKMLSIYKPTVDCQVSTLYVNPLNPYVCRVPQTPVTQ